MPLLLILAGAACAQFSAFYSPADSIIYATYGSLHPTEEDTYLVFRFRDGGSAIDRIEHDMPGRIVTSDRVPGRLYSYRRFVDSIQMYRSDDWGENWRPMGGPRLPDLAVIPEGVAGDAPGQSWLGTSDFGGRVYFTSDSWDTFDSVQVNVPDWIWFRSFAYQSGVLYGDCQGDVICVSSDTGRTWHLGGNSPYAWYVHPGVPDELWMVTASWERYTTFLLTDTGRTYHAVFTAQLPARPWPWEFGIYPTDHPGEAYGFADWVDWSPYVEFVIYHIQDYGAVVDSFYYFCPNFEVGATDERAPVPTAFSIRVYPNPFNSTACLQLDGDLHGASEITVFDLLGRRVWEWRGLERRILLSATMMSESGLPSSKYWIRVKCGRSQQTVPVIYMK